MRIFYTSQFKRDYKRLKRQNKDLTKLQIIVGKLIAGEQLTINYRDHPLTGNWKGFRDCHLEPDWILIYKITEDVLIMERTGSHSELFKK